MEIKIELLLFSIIFGIFLLYIFSPKPQIILKYPNENNIYIDNNNVCYKYKKKIINN